MLKYTRIPFKNAQGNEGFRYTKNGLITKESRIPHEVMERFAYNPTVEYDDEPDRRRCIFCDAPQKRVRGLNLVMIDLCEYHYQTKNLGKIAEQVRELEKEPKPVKKKKRRKK